jgi:hypothetical protein
MTTEKEIADLSDKIEAIKKEISAQGKTPVAFDQASYDAWSNDDYKMEDLAGYYNTLRSQRSRKARSKKEDHTTKKQNARTARLLTIYRELGSILMEDNAILPPPKMKRVPKRTLIPGKLR